MPPTARLSVVYVLELAGEDDRFAAYEARNAVTDVEGRASGLAVARSIVPDRLQGLAFTHRASRIVGQTDASVASARHLVESSRLDRAGSVAVRARDVRGTAGIDTRFAEHELGSVLVDRGFTVDLDEPDHELRALFADDVCVIGWLIAESVRGFDARAPTDKPFFHPGSMDPLLARALVNIAGTRPGRRILDPMCGTGGLLVEAGLLGAHVVGIDAQRRMVHGALRNLRHYLDEDTFAVGQGDAARLPIVDDGVDAVVFDAPYGRQSKVEGRELSDLIAGALNEARRVAPRAIVVGDRSWDSTARETGWRIEATFERRTHRSLTRHVHVLTAPER